MAPGNLVIDAAPETTSGGGTTDESEVTNDPSEASLNRTTSSTGDNGTGTWSVSTGTEPGTEAASAGGPVASPPTGHETVTTARLLSPQVSALLESSSLDGAGDDGASSGLCPEFAGSGAFVSAESLGNAGGNTPWEEHSAGAPGNGSSQTLLSGKSSTSSGGGISSGGTPTIPSNGSATASSPSDSAAPVLSSEPSSSSQLNSSSSNSTDVRTDISIPTQGLEGWSTFELGGSAAGKGSVSTDADALVLTEGDSFEVVAERPVTIPADPGQLTFRYQELSFSTPSTHDINDAFEVALVGADGKSLVPTYSAKRDAFFNITAGQPMAMGASTSTDTENLRVSLDISALPAGTQGTIIFRLVNNDRTTDTSVRILGDSQAPGVFADLQNDTAPVDSTNPVFGSDGITTDTTMAGSVSGDVKLLQVQLDGGVFEDITASITDSLFQYQPYDLETGLHEVVFRATSSMGLTADAVVNFTYSSGPTAVITGSMSVTEGSTAVFDSGNSAIAGAELYQRTWLLPDGSVATGTSLPFTFPDDGTFPMSLTVEDIAGASQTTVVNITVANAAPTLISSDNRSVTVGQMLTLPVATFSDPGFTHVSSGTLETFTSTVDWGDGTEIQPVIVSMTPGGIGVLSTGTVTGTHTYAAVGNYQVIVTVIDDDGGTGTAAFTITVNSNLTAKFTVVDETSLKLFHYSSGGQLVGQSSLVDGNGANSHPRGVTSNATGDMYWVIDSNNTVYVYNRNGAFRGSWKPSGIRSPRDIATDGRDIWIVDDWNGSKLFRFIEATSRTSGSQTASTVFKLDANNTQPTGLVFRDNTLWITDAADSAVARDHDDRDHDDRDHDDRDHDDRDHDDRDHDDRDHDDRDHDDRDHDDRDHDDRVHDDRDHDDRDHDDRVHDDRDHDDRDHDDRDHDDRDHDDRDHDDWHSVHHVCQTATVYRYSIAGVKLGKWTLDSRNSAPTGIALNPTGGTDLWVVDKQDDVVYRYAAGTTWTSGSHTATSTFSLAGSNSGAEGIVDPVVATVSFIGTSNPAWNLASNWSSGVVPGVNDDVVIPAGKTVLIDRYVVNVKSLSLSGTLTIVSEVEPGDGVFDYGDLFLSSPSCVETGGLLTLNGGRIRGDGDLQVNGTIQFNDGLMDGAGTLTISSTGTLNGKSPGYFNGAPLIARSYASFGLIRIESGTLSISGTGTIAGQTVVTSGATLKIQGGTTTFDTATALRGETGLGAGTLRVSSGSVVFPETGLEASFPLSLSLSPQLAGLPTLHLRGGYNAANVLVSGGVLQVDSPATLNNLTQTGGTIQGAGDLVLHGTNVWNSGTQNGPGQTIVAEDATLSFGGGEVVLNRQFSNHGTSSVQTFGDVLVVGMSGSITNSGTFLLNPGLSFATTTGSSATFTNSGVLRKPANGFSSQLALPLINSGQVEVLNSELILTAGGSNTGIIAINGGATLSLLSGSFINETAGVYSGAGTVAVKGAQLVFSGEAPQSHSNRIVLTSGKILGTADVTFQGVIDWSSGTIEGTGGLAIGENGTLNISGSTALLDRTLTNHGSIIWSGDVFISATGQLVNQTDGRMDLRSGSLSPAVEGQSVLTLENHGLVEKTQASVFPFGLNISVANTGSLDLLTGTVEATRSITTDGTVNIATDAQLTVTGATFLQTAGTTTLTGGALFSDRVIDLQGGVFTGIGTVNASIRNAALLRPGNPFGLMIITKDYTQTSTGILAEKIAGPVAGVGYGQLRVQGGITLAGSILLEPLYQVQPADRITVIDHLNSNLIAGHFNGYPAGTILMSGDYAYQVDYQGGTGNDVVLTATAPGLSIYDVARPQVASGTTVYEFSVTLDRAADQPVTVDYQTQDITATAGVDYFESYGTLTFEPGSTSKTIAVHVFGDANPQPSRQFQVVLSNPRNGAVAQTAGFGTIVGALQPSAGFTDAGKDFWFTMPYNRGIVDELDPNIDPADIKFTLFITAASPSLGAHGTVTIPGMGFSTPWNVAANSTTTVDIPVSSMAQYSDLVQNKGIHLVSDDNDVAVKFLNHRLFGSDSFTAIPTPSLGTDYRVMSYGNVGVENGTEFTIVATEDGTIVSITPQSTYNPSPDEPWASPRIAGQAYTVELQKGNVYQLIDSNDVGADFTGTLIHANRPIAVLSGHSVSNIPSGYEAANFIVEQMRPNTEWGTSHVTVPFAARLGGDTIRILAHNDDTVVHMNGVQLATLQAGEFYETIRTTATEFTSNYPVLVAQFANSLAYENPLINTLNPGSGDPSMLLVTPTSNFSSRFSVTVPWYQPNGDGFYEINNFAINYVNIVVPTSAVGSIHMNGSPLATSLFTPIASSSFSSARIPVARAAAFPTYTFDSSTGDVPITGYSYGFGPWDAYSNPAGFGEAVEVGSIALTPAAEETLVGRQTSVTATVLSPEGQPLVGVAVSFSISGVNHQGHVAYTDAFGKARFLYVGEDSGHDAITATVFPQSGPMSATAAKDWIRVQPAISVNSPASGDQVTAGTTILVSGRAVPGRADVPIADVTLDGVPVDAVDASGRFFARFPVTEGRQTLTFITTDILGGTASTTIDLTGVTTDIGAVNGTELVEAENFEETYYRTSFDHRTKTLYADVALHNSGQFPLGKPLYVGIRNISDPTVLVRDFDGLLPDGTPYFDFSKMLAQGQLFPGTNTGIVTVAFYTPAESRFTYDLVLVGDINLPPEITSVPKVSAFEGEDYRYQLAALDPDGDLLTYRIVSGPEDMLISGSGLVEWQPTTTNIGTYPVSLMVTDPFGRSSLQTWLLSVQTAPTNRPPLLESIPVLTASVGAPYNYTVTASDVDGDELLFSIEDGPDELFIDPESGVITWSPRADQVGSQQLRILVDDGHGGTAIQSFQIAVLSMAGNTSPVIAETEFSFSATANVNFRHLVRGIDADGDTLTCEIITAPHWMEIDSDSGLMSGTPLIAQAGNQSATVRVSDGRGGTVEATYEINVIDVTPGGISGTIFSDTDGDGVRDSGESAVSGWTVYVDVNQNGAADLDEPTATSALTGEYSIPELTPGSYSLEILPQAGWVRTLPLPRTVLVEITPGQMTPAQDFGVIAATRDFAGPTVTPVVQLNVYAGQKILHHVNAVSPDGLPLTYSLAYGPDGVAVDSRTGIVSWTPDSLGSFTLGVIVNDGYGHVAGQVVYVSVAQRFVPPTITSEPAMPAVAGWTFQYQVEAQDFVDGTNLTYSISQGSFDLQIDAQTGKMTWDVPSDFEGAVTFTVTASNSVGLTATQQITLPVVKAITNQPPTVLSDPPTVAYRNVDFEYRVVAVDIEGSVLTYDFAGTQPAGMEISDIGLIQWHPEQIGTYSFTVEISDGQGGVTQFPVTLDVVEVTTIIVPEIMPVSPGRALVYHPYQYQVWVQDTSATPILYSLETAPIGMQINPVTGLITFTAQPYQIGDRSFRVQATNGTTGSSAMTFTLPVVDSFTNTSPVISSTPPGPASIDRPYVYHVTASDPNGDVLEYRLDRAPAGMTISSTSGLITWVPSTSQVGMNRMEISVSDGRGGTTTQWFELPTVVTSINHLPVIDSSPAQNPLIPDQQFRYQLVAHDVDGDLLTYRMESSFAGMQLNSTTGLFSWNPQSVTAGTYRAVLSVSDGRDGIARQTINLVVLDSPEGTVNQIPEITSTPTGPAVVGHHYEYRVQAHDSDGDALTWSVTSAMTGFAITTDGRLTWSPIAQTSGNVTVTVSDLRGGTATQTFLLGAYSDASNAAPVFATEASTKAFAGSVYQYAAYAWDADGDPVSYRLINPVQGMEINSETGVFRWTPTSRQAGAHTVWIVAEDGRGGETLHPFAVTVTVADENHSPVIDSASQIRTILADTAYIDTVIAHDPDFEVLTYTLNSTSAEPLPAGLTISSIGVITWAPGIEDLGVTSFTVTVSDGRLASATSLPFSLTVTTAGIPIDNQAPVILSTAPVLALIGHEYAYNATGWDADGDSLLWTLEDAPDLMSINSHTGTIRWTPVLSQRGSHTVILRLSDAAGASISQPFTIVVNEVVAPPQITSVPNVNATVSQWYQYQVGARTSTPQPLNYSLTSAPAWISINSATGLISGLPTSIGSFIVELRVTDALGQSATQSYQINSVFDVNTLPPVILTEPNTVAVVDETYTQQIIAEDPQGQNVTLSFSSRPIGMEISPTGLITWTPGATGSAVVEVVATNEAFKTSRLRFTISVHANEPPSIYSTPPTTVTAGTLFRYDLLTITHGDTVRYEFDEAPDGMQIDSLGRISWPTTLGNIGTQHIVVRAINGGGLSSLPHAFDLNVVADTQAPAVVIRLSRNRMEIGSSVTVLVSATDNVGLAGRTLRANGILVMLDASGSATLTYTTPGPITFTADAFDTAGNTGTATATLTVFDPSVTGEPTGSLNIADGATLSQPTDILGTVFDAVATGLSYTLTLTASGGGPAKILATGTGLLTNAFLAKLDTTSLDNGEYELTLLIVNAGDNTTTVSRRITVASDFKLGNFKLSFTDMTIPVSGFPLTVIRSYDSLRAKQDGDFGKGWSLELANTRVEVKYPVGFDGLSSFEGSYTPFRDGTRVIITLPGGKREGFTFYGTPGTQFASAVFDWIPKFYADAGVTSQLITDQTRLIKVQGSGEYLDTESNHGFNPADPVFGGAYTLKLRNGTELAINAETGELASITDLTGNTTLFTGDSIESSAGRRIQFARDWDARITSVIDSQSGKAVSYAYDGVGNLVSVTDPVQATTQFAYMTDGSNYLDTIIDPFGREAARTEYGANGRVSKVTDAAGKTIEYTYDLDTLVQTVTDQLGNVTTITLNSNGDAVREVGPTGSITTRTFDNDHRLLSETTVVGLEDSVENGETNDLTISNTYDLNGNQLTSTDKYGNVTRTGYNGHNQPTSQTDAFGNTTQTGYDPHGLPTSIRDVNGNVTSLKFDARGNPTEIRDDNGNLLVTNVYNQYGEVVSSTSVFGRTTYFDYDLNGNQVASWSFGGTGPDQVQILNKTEFDHLNRNVGSIQAVLPAGHFITTNLATAIIPAQYVVSQTSTVYNAAGQVTSTIDANGLETQNTFDVRGQLIQTRRESVDENGNTVWLISRTAFDAAGRTIASTSQYVEGSSDPVFGTLSTYDAVGRVTLSQQVRGLVISITGTINNEEAVVTNAGIVISSSSTTYDGISGRVTSSVDSYGRTSQNVYNELGDVTESRRQAFDENGNSVWFVARTVYDSFGRAVISTEEYPEGTSEPIRGTKTVYDPQGRTIRSLQQSGVVVAIDSVTGNSTLISSGTIVAQNYTNYNADGRVDFTTDAYGLETHTTWDSLGRTTETRRQAVDQNGNIVWLVSRTVYDSLGRVDVSTDEYQEGSPGPIYGTRSIYDELGRTVRTVRLEGVSISIHSVTGNSTLTAPGTALWQAETIYNDDGTVFKQMAADGQVTEYEYDAFRRQVAVIGTPVVINGQTVRHRRETVYDDQGRTLQQRTNITQFVNGTIDATDVQTTTYEYDSRGNLVKTTYADATIIQMTYDDRGRKLTETNQMGLTRTFAYDSQGRLASVTLPDLDGNPATTNDIATYRLCVRCAW